MTEEFPKPKARSRVDEPPAPDRPIDLGALIKLDEWTAREEAKAVTPEQKIDVKIRRARLQADAGYYDAATKDYEAAMNEAVANGMYALQAKLVQEVGAMEAERLKHQAEKK